MCLGIPGRIVWIEGASATVDFWGTQREVRLDRVEEPVGVGDYVVSHVGFAIRRIPDSEVSGILEVYDELLAATSSGDA